MRHTFSLIVAAIAPLAVIATNPAMTTTESIPGSGQSQMSNLKEDTFAARRPRAKSVTRRDLSRRASKLVPRTNRATPVVADPQTPEET